ncbi:uncharacterized protein ATNIH1004_001655 [Aspergillus tanneri]|uniref:Uncharacterized protein n=1 Tax=Aspergillus tanneri TaxID=1220188 RepID=A0A5M9N4W2_9EURO|nr:uncharacterized protein ATNIH1004_001655 [Aspergillus tanneri]KAA8652750.1 hypothetical protein ATNIH1004_001655 [Aspergillus tanneri]
MPDDQVSDVQSAAWDQLMHNWARNSMQDLSDRALLTASYSVGMMLAHGEASAAADWQATKVLRESYASVRERFLAAPMTASYLCRASRTAAGAVASGDRGSSDV